MSFSSIHRLLNKKKNLLLTTEIICFFIYILSIISVQTVQCSVTLNPDSLECSYERTEHNLIYTHTHFEQHGSDGLLSPGVYGSLPDPETAEIIRRKEI